VLQAMNEGSRNRRVIPLQSFGKTGQWSAPGRLQPGIDRVAAALAHQRPEGPRRIDHAPDLRHGTNERA
jgi:hypothetical protein